MAYFTIPITLRSLARRPEGLPFPWMFFLFGAFEAYTRICAQNHELPIIFATGYSAEMSQPHDVQRRHLPILQKPYAPRDLARKVREALDQRRLVSHD